MAEGVRETLTIDDTFAHPDSALRDFVTDTWTSMDLQAVLRQDTNDDSNTQMTNLRMEEQAASLFRVPPDYRIEDERQDFFIDYPIRGHSSFPVVISRVQATYAPSALNSGIQGVVLVATTVDEGGRARDVHVERSLDLGLDQEAVKAVSQWRFRPGQQDGRRVRMNVTVEVRFALN